MTIEYLDHSTPVALMHECSELARKESFAAGVVVLLDGEDRLLWRMCGLQKKDLLWALERAKAELMEEG